MDLPVEDGLPSLLLTASPQLPRLVSWSPFAANSRVAAEFHSLFAQKPRKSVRIACCNLITVTWGSLPPAT